MNRLQKKCFIASTALHALLVLTLLFGAALMPREKQLSSNILTIYGMVTDAPTHGGSPNVQQLPPSQPDPPRPVPPAEPKPPEPVKPPTVAKPKDPEPVKPPKLTKDELTLAPRKEVKPPVNQPQNQTDAQAKEVAEARNRLASQINNTVRTLKGGLSRSTVVEMPGTGGGPLMANYMDIVRSRYTAAWNPPASLEDDSATVTVSVVIARDGRVVARDILKSSGNAAMDKSVQSTLENVTFIEAFPAESKDLQRKFVIKFNLAAKRLLG